MKIITNGANVMTVEKKKVGRPVKEKKGALIWVQSEYVLQSALCWRDFLRTACFKQNLGNDALKLTGK
jgi:hypothetical protein